MRSDDVRKFQRHFLSALPPYITFELERLLRLDFGRRHRAVAGHFLPFARRVLDHSNGR
jgi:hypothetical protein